MKTEQLNAHAFGLAGAILSAACMLVLGVLGSLGLYMKAVTAMMDWHVFFSLSPIGVIGGMVEAAVISYVGLYAFVWIYNKFR